MRIFCNSFLKINKREKSIKLAEERDGICGRDIKVIFNFSIIYLYWDLNVFISSECLYDGNMSMAPWCQGHITIWKSTT